MKVLITGCGGQVGRCLTERLKDKVDVLALDHQALDIANLEAVMNAVGNFNPEYIINAAAYTSVDAAEQEVELSYAINCDGPRNLAQAAEKYGSVILHISTDYAFDGEKKVSYLESDNPRPQSVYGKSKLAGEQAVSENCHRYIVLRTAWVFGEYGNNFVKTMLRLAQTRDEITIVADQIGGPTYAGDIADALIDIIQYIEDGNVPEWGVYHFSGMPYTSWYEFAKVIFLAAEQYQAISVSPRIVAISTSAYPTLAKRPTNSRLDCSKIKNQFGIKPSDWKGALKNIQAYK
ncbi:dTDP-4-dehydrorhamnose reductase [Vibrio fluvialis]|nr:dTDP-4-dehydrorhamnose reductase [Vibrio fluvialis]